MSASQSKSTVIPMCIFYSASGDKKTEATYVCLSLLQTHNVWAIGLSVICKYSHVQDEM